MGAAAGFGLFTGVEIGRGVKIGVGAGVGAAVIIRRGTTVGVGDGTAVCENTLPDEQTKAKKANKTIFFINLSGKLKSKACLPF